jgi:hypothetical protein
MVAVLTAAAVFTHFRVKNPPLKLLFVGLFFLPLAAAQLELERPWRRATVASF